MGKTSEYQVRWQSRVRGAWDQFWSVNYRAKVPQLFLLHIPIHKNRGSEMKSWSQEFYYQAMNNPNNPLWAFVSWREKDKSELSVL